MRSNWLTFHESLRAARVQAAEGASRAAADAAREKSHAMQGLEESLRMVRASDPDK